MRTTILLAALALAAAHPVRQDTLTLAIHITYHPVDINAARLADAMTKACAVPSMNCTIADRSNATTFLHVMVQSLWRRPLGTGEVWSSERPVEDPAARQVFTGFVDIKSQVMIPGLVDARDESLERLGASLLGSVRDRLAERRGVVVIEPN